VVATRYAVIPERPYALWYLLFTLAIATIVLLRARAFADRWQSIILTVAPVVAFAVVLGRYAASSTPPDLTVTLICVAITLGVAVVGLVVALVVVTAKVNAPMRRLVEFAEYVLLFPIIPMAAWLLGLYEFARNLFGGP
jgi:hypothetical protein